MNDRSTWPFGVGLLLAFTVLSCAPQGFDGPTYDTQHLHIETSFQEPLCAGDLTEFEDFVDHVEEALGVELETPLNIFLREDPFISDWQGCGRVQAGQLGCYRHSTHTVYTDFSVSHHELTHAITASLGRTSPFLGEGIATAMGAGIVLFNIRGIEPASSLRLSTSELTYTDAAHFTRWLLETRGAAKWRELYAKGVVARGGRERDFEDVYGITFAELQAEYLKDAPWIYEPSYRFEVPSLQPQEEGFGWYEEIEFDCSRDDTFGRSDSISVRRTLKIPAAGIYDFWTSADTVGIRQALMAPLRSMEEVERATFGDAPISIPIAPTGLGASIVGGQVGALELDAGRYTVYIVDFERGGDPAAVLITPHDGSLAVVPAD